MSSQGSESAGAAGDGTSPTSPFASGGGQNASSGNWRRQQRNRGSLGRGQAAVATEVEATFKGAVAALNEKGCIFATVANPTT
jgi:hypothetical protein